MKLTKRGQQAQTGRPTTNANDIIDIRGFGRKGPATLGGGAA
jgi:hypothetical protein